MSNLSIGQYVSVHHDAYQLLAFGPLGTGKFSGKRSFLLRSERGELFQAYGKTVSGNSKLTPAKAPYWCGIVRIPGFTTEETEGIPVEERAEATGSSLSDFRAKTGR